MSGFPLSGAIGQSITDSIKAELVREREWLCEVLQTLGTPEALQVLRQLESWNGQWPVRAPHTLEILDAVSRQRVIDELKHVWELTGKQ